MTPEPKPRTDKQTAQGREFTFGTDEGEAPLDVEEYLEGPPPAKTEDDD